MPAPFKLAPLPWDEDALAPTISAGTISFHAPRLPEYIDWVELRDLRVGEGSVDLVLQRHHHNVGVEIMRKQGEVSVRIDV